MAWEFCPESKCRPNATARCGTGCPRVTKPPAVQVQCNDSKMVVAMRYLNRTGTWPDADLEESTF